MNSIFASLEKLQKHAFHFLQAYKSSKIMEIFLSRVKKIKNYGDNFFKLKKHRFDVLQCEKNSKNMNIIFASLKILKKAHNHDFDFL